MLKRRVFSIIVSAAACLLGEQPLVAASPETVLRFPKHSVGKVYLLDETFRSGLCEIDGTRTFVADAAGTLHLRDGKYLLVMSDDGTGDPAFQLASAGPIHAIELARSKINDDWLRRLSNLTNLRKLDLSYTGVSDIGIETLSKLKLTELYLGHSKASRACLSTLSCKKTLVRLCLRSTSSSSSNNNLAELKNFTRLDDLDLCDTNTNDQDMGNISQIRSMRNLTLTNTKVTDSGIKKLGSLRDLQGISLSGTPVTDESLKVIRMWPHLRRLRLSATNISDETVRAIPQRIEFLDLANTRLSAKSAEPLSKMQDLNYLNLSYSKLPGTVLTKLATLSKMQELNLSGMKFSPDFASTVFSKMPLLTRLDLRGTNISDKDCVYLRRLKRITYLDLQGTAITDKGLELLMQMHSLRTLNISYTSVTEDAYKRFTAALPLCKTAWLPIQ